MKFQHLLLLTFIFISTNALARRPAVEDFVGVEPESYREIKAGNVFAYDFTKGQQAPEKPVESTPSSLFSILVLLGFISLPMMMWMAMARDLPQTTTNTQMPNNVTQVDFSKQKKSDDDDQQLPKAS